MTAEDRALDPTILLQNPLFLYRLVRKKYADLSGAGAALSPGRWNRAGQKAIYTSTEMSITLLERLAHSPKEVIPSNLAMMKLRVHGDWVLRDDELFDPNHGGTLLVCRTLLSAQRHLQGLPPFKSFLKPFAVAVPSVIVPSWNVVLYPDGTAFWEHVSIDSIDPFEFDPRLFPEGAVTQDED